MLSLTPKPWSNMVCQSYGTTGVRKNSLGEIVHVNKKTIVRLVYCTLVLDNILLTVVGKLKIHIILSNKIMPITMLNFQYLSYQSFYTNMLWRSLQTKQIKILTSYLKPLKIQMKQKKVNSKFWISCIEFFKVQFTVQN